MINNYYKKSLSPQLQAVYEQMYRGFIALQSTFQVFPCTITELSDIFFRIRLDHPEIFYVVSFKCRTWAGAETIEFLPEYMFDNKKIEAQKASVNARINKLCLPMKGKTDFEKELFIHDFICSSVTYDKLKKPYSHEIIGPLQNGVGVCEGIAKTVKVMCDNLGMDCILAISVPQDDSKYLHAWNIIKVDGKYYHLDATFDNSLSDDTITRYDYFNLDDEHIFRDHAVLKYPVMQCGDNGAFFYKTKKISFTKEEDVLKRVSQALKKKKDCFIFHWRGNVLTRKQFNNLMVPCLKEADALGYKLTCRVNFPQSVIEIRIRTTGEDEVITVDNDKLVFGEVT